MPLKKCFPCLKFQNDEVITKFDCSNTLLADVFPDVWQHERTLEELYLTSTRINSLPPQLFYCQSLRILMVNNNNLVSIPNAIGTLRQLHHLNFSRNLISNVPDSIKTCKNLTHLDLCCNNLQRLPDAITCLISLQELLLNETYLEFLPANFGRLVNLKILELRINNLITLPKSMARLSNLQRIDIGGNEFTELPDVIGELKQLRELWIDFNQIRRISPNIAKLRELQHFEANGNLIDSLPNEISHWRCIEVLSICTNNIETLPFSIGMMKSLVTLKCESNDLRELPDSISNLENLEELVLSHNQLLRLPTTIGMLRKLRFLFADGNELRTLPDEICSCSNLGVLSVSRNKIIELPQNIGHLTKLKVLNLVNNCICHLPVSVLSLVNLTSLWISDNQSQPLVPLQYLDASKKTKLTCFMLPQVGIQLQQSTVANYNQQQPKQQESEQESDVFNLTLFESDQWNVNQQQPQGMRQINSTKAALTAASSSNLCGSPSKRICFADEATILNTAPRTPSDSLIEIETSTLNSSPGQPQQNMGLRLIRSPTPYPKELRLMSRYVRNGPKPPTKHTAGISIATNSNGDTTIFDDSNQCEVILPAANSTIQIQNGDYDLHFANALHTNPNYVRSPNPQINLNNDQLQQCYDAYYLAPSNFKNLPSDNVAHNYNNMSIMPLQAQHDNQQEAQQTSLMPEHCYSNNSTVSTLQKSQLLEPPPYHIACVFTKKTPEDLTMYDSMRTRHEQHQQQQNLHISQQSFNNQTTLNQTDMMLQQSPQVTTVNNFDQSINSNNCIQRQVATAHSYSTANLALDHSDNILQLNQVELNGLDKKNGMELPLAEQQQLEKIIQDQHFNNKLAMQQSSSMEFENIAKSGTKKASATPWLFGVHKNPTVKQVTLKWEHNIGFEIDEIPNKEGIYVSSIVSNTHAARLLCVHDKLLEIDGFDLTNLHLNETRKIILNAGPSINIMLSRK